MYCCRYLCHHVLCYMLWIFVENVSKSQVKSLSITTVTRCSRGVLPWSYWWNVFFWRYLSVIGFVINMDTLLMIPDLLQVQRYVCAYRFSQDHLELFFNSVRASGRIFTFIISLFSPWARPDIGTIWMGTFEYRFSYTSLVYSMFWCDRPLRLVTYWWLLPHEVTHPRKKRHIRHQCVSFYSLPVEETWLYSYYLTYRL